MNKDMKRGLFAAQGDSHCSGPSLSQDSRLHDALGRYGIVREAGALEGSVSCGDIRSLVGRRIARSPSPILLRIGLGKLRLSWNRLGNDRQRLGAGRLCWN